MSFQLPTATALPAEVQLGKEKPQGAYCLRTRYALSANSANSWQPSNLVSLPLQTGTPGTFTDVKQGCINCTLQITNSNPYVDYLNFGPCGAMIFFEEMRIYSSGTPIEENLRYSECVDLMMNQGGWSSKPYHVYRRNQWRAANGRAGDKHVNFIKPSMVDSMGCPMFGRTPFMDRNSSVFTAPSIQFGYNTTVANSTTAVDFAYKTAGIPSQTGDPGIPTLGQIVGCDGSGTFCDLGFRTVEVGGAGAAAAPYNGFGTAYGFNSDLQTVYPGRNPTHVSQKADNVFSKNDMFSWRNTQVGRAAPTAAQVTAAPWLGVAQFVPTQWPDFQPSTLMGEIEDDEIDILQGYSKVSEYMKYLSNVRSLPIGVKGKVAAAGYQAQFATLATADTSQLALNEAEYGVNYTEYRLSMPFLSGVYGILADKMFPDLLIGANNIRIEFKLASAAKAMWLTMDPCRRVPGTMRDFVPFTGSANGGNRKPLLVESGFLMPTTSDGATQSSALGCELNGLYIAAGGASAGAGGTAEAALSWNSGEITANALLALSHCYTSDAALGLDLVPPSLQAIVSSATGGKYSTVAVASIAVAAALPGFHLSNVSNLPKPQYVPHASPWKSKELTDSAGLLKTAYVNERAACFGTYLPASQPQTRRCQLDSRLDCKDSFQSQTGVTTFSIRDLQYIGEQVQLDDITASAITSQAANAEIVVWTRGYRSFEANCDANEQQNIILPIQIGQATALYLVFRPSVILTSPDYYSNSFVCPFVGLGFNNVVAGDYIGQAGQKPDVGGVYTVSSSLDSNSMGSFSYQLFSGTKQYPLQPIQTVAEMLVEKEKSMHSLHNWAWSSSDLMSLQRWGTTQSGGSANGFSYDPFIDMGFFTTFVPVSALDDQTITQNPYFQLAELTSAGGVATFSTAGRIRGVRAPPLLASTAGKFAGTLNKFISPIGTFFLGWDFESWTNHEDVMRTGKFLGQEQLSVRITGTKLMSPLLSAVQNVNSSSASVTAVGCTALVPHIVKLSFIPGGHVLSYY